MSKIISNVNNNINQNNTPLNICIICNENTDKEKFNNLFSEIKKIGFNISWELIDIEKKNDLPSFSFIDIVFIDYQKEFDKIFNWDLKIIKSVVENDYIQILMFDHCHRDIYQYLRMGIDDTLYYQNNSDFFKWKIIAILRRLWDKHKHKTTITYKGLIIDNIEKQLYLKNEKIKLTKKEFAVVSLLMSNIGIGYLTKRKIFELVWKTMEQDWTRVVDQILFKIKKKLGKEYFEINRKGIKII